MEFCPKCDSVLLPQKKGRGFKLVCPRCKYARKFKKRAGYKISEEGKEAREVAIIEGEKKKKKQTPKSEYEIDMDYYEDFYE